jgi:cysteine desulfurase
VNRDDSGRVYLDHAATSPMVPVAVEALTDQLGRSGNASSLHGSGRAARRVVEECREQIAAAVGARPAEVIFTAGGTEADNLALIGSARARPDRPELVISSIEHPAVAETAIALGHEGRTLAEVPVDDTAVIDLAALSGLIGPRTAVTSVMWANNEVGTLQPLAQVAELARRHGSWVHADAVQALGHLPIRFDDHDLDLVSLSAHKIGGPAGVGALLARRELTLTPVTHGGGQERDVRSGTVPVALIAGFAAAVAHAVAVRADEAVRLRVLRDRLVDTIMSTVEDARLNGTLDPGRSLPGIANVEFAGCEADALLMLLDRVGIDASTGSACTAGVSRPSEVLMAMGRTATEAGSALRFSLGWTSTDADVDALLAALPAAVTSARAASLL